MTRRTVIELAIFLALLAALVLALWLPIPSLGGIRERIDTLSPGPYVVETMNHGRQVFMVYTESEDGKVADSPDWSPLPEQAWHFDTWDDAYFRAQPFGASVKQLRGVMNHG